MKIRELTLRRLKHRSSSSLYDIFLSVYQKLFLNDELSSEDIEKILAMVVLFTNQAEEIMQRLGYRMALAYGNKTKDFTPLYDLAINSGLIPVVALLKSIEDLPLNLGSGKKDSFLSNMVDSYIDNFRDNNIVLTEQQYRLNEFFNNSIGETSTVVAPTSYGKSELIISAIRKSTNKKICILVPTKSLLAQTRKRVLDAKVEWVSRIVSHPEMHNPNDISSIYILTQERLTRVLNQDKNMSFEIVIIDEAHNLLNTVLCSNRTKQSTT
ncbi:MAG: DEAD/DEAH box helicase [Methylobacter sp.]|nr:DEAD/DEAH box helicase [Methylobacter sp.]